MKPLLRTVRWPAIAALSCALVASSAVAGNAAGTPQADDIPPACGVPTRTNPPPASPGPTTVTTLEQAYYCIFANYYAGPVLNDEVLLLGAFAGLTQELDILGDDKPDATMPALTGDRDSDWTAFSTAYQHIVDELPTDATLRQQVAEATMNGMVASLDDNHARWGYPSQPPPGYQQGDSDGLGIVTSPSGALATIAPNEALPPLYISAIQGGPAAQAGLEPGDVIASVNGSAPFVDGQVSPGVFGLLNEQYPDEQPVRITLWRPATNRTWTVTLTPALFQPTAAATRMVTSQLLDGDVADIKLAQFGANAADDVLNAIAALAAGHTLHGIILDLRGNGGGDPNEVATLLGAFEHGAAWGYSCPLSGGCTASYPDATVALLNLPLTVLTDRNCASACDAFSAAVKDLHLGTLIGTRTAGAASGQAQAFMLDDASLLELPAARWLGPDQEVVNTIGVAPDYVIPLTALDVSTGHDPDVAKALALLNS